jgi:hypothetical protein
MSEILWRVIQIAQAAHSYPRRFESVRGWWHVCDMASEGRGCIDVPAGLRCGAKSHVNARQRVRLCSETFVPRTSYPEMRYRTVQDNGRVRVKKEEAG